MYDNKRTLQVYCFVFLNLPYFDSRTDAHKTEAEKAADADAEILAAITSRRKLASHMELAKGVQYLDPIRTSYVPW